MTLDTLQVLWEGCDGSTWDLLDPFSPVRATNLLGLGLPGFTQQFSEAAAVDGRVYEGTTWGANTVTMTVLVGDDYVPDGYTERRTGEAWRALDRSWRASLSPELTGNLVVISGVGRRQLELRLAPEVPTPDGGIQPGHRGKAIYEYTLTADDNPWWTGEEQSDFWEFKDESQPFFGGATGSVLLYISPASAIQSAAIPNPGSRPVPPRWWARGRYASLSVGVGDVMQDLPFPLDQGQEVHVDSATQTITDADGNSLWPLMGYADATFPAIPAGELVPVRIELTGAQPGAGVGVSVRPRFNGPW